MTVPTNLTTSKSLCTSGCITTFLVAGITTTGDDGGEVVDLDGRRLLVRVVV